MSITSDCIRNNGFIHDLADQAADEIEQMEAEIERLKAAREEAIEDALQASPEFDLLNRIGRYLSNVCYVGDHVEGIKQVQRDALESAIRVVETYSVSVGNSAAGERASEWAMENLREIRDELREMAEEI